jgi:uncharacterized protein (TIGR02145 family)
MMKKSTLHTREDIMKKKFRLFLFLLAVLIVPALFQASATTLSNASPNHTITSGSDEQVYGTSASNLITLESGAKAELINFPGQNSIQIQSSSDLFSVSRSGTVVTFQGLDGTILKIPTTTSVQTVSFNGEESRVLHIHNNQVMLDDQEITTIATEIEGSQEEPVTCGANVAPGVWKEFDCYNLAAIGKTTNDDPFTPSWRLIGGYWQWGRKGPDASQWYDTNTPHFAQGPTGPGDSEANAGEISGWSSSNAPNGAWSDTTKTANDPCPSGFRVPTRAQWDGVRNNNTQSTVGTWSSGATDYDSARSFGDKLLLPAAGNRGDKRGGALSDRGDCGFYWSSSDFSSGGALYLFVGSGQAEAGTYGYSRSLGFSIRCISE